MKNDFSKRLKYFRSLRDLSQQELAKLVGISGKQVSDYEVGSSKPRQTTYLKILNALGVTHEEFSNTENPMSKASSSLLLQVPIFSWNDVIDLEEAVPEQNITLDMLLYPTSNSKSLFILRVQGSAMSPLVNEGDLVMIDTSKNKIEDGAAYIVSNGIEATLKQCFKTFSGNILLKSINPDFPSFETEETKINIIGKVVYRFSTL